jgi:hypothetical protein
MPEQNEIKVRCVHARMEPVETMLPRRHPKNPNKHSPEQIRLLAKIVQYQGWRGCIVVSNRSGKIVEGHGRLEAAVLLGVPMVPVDCQDFDTDEQELAHLIADNTIAEFSHIHDGQLKSLLKKLEDADIDLELAGILAEMEEPEAEAEYPIAARLQEHYDYVVVFTTNEMDFAFLQEVMGLERVQSYKKTGVGLGRVVPFKQFYDSITANRNSFRQQGGNTSDAPTGATGGSVSP